jgi:predicted aspartyl protease
MKSWTITLILIFILVPALALSEIYYWVDDQGIQNYTTRLESIPEPYRLHAQRLSLPTSPPPPPELQLSTSQKVLTKVPFTPGSPVLVSARINGTGPITLILDTGSDRTLVTPSALEKLGLSTENVNRAVLKGVTGMSYGDALWVQSVEVGEAKVGPLLIIVLDTDLKKAEGLLGRDFLANFNVTINPKEGIVTLAPN